MGRDQAVAAVRAAAELVRPARLAMIRMISARRPAPPFLFVADRDSREVQLVHHVGDEVGQVVRRQPFLQGCRQQQLLVRIVGKVSLDSLVKSLCRSN